MRNNRRKEEVTPGTSFPNPNPNTNPLFIIKEVKNHKRPQT